MTKIKTKPKAKVMKCVVLDCVNYDDQGTFCGDLCFPCWKMLTTGKLGYGSSFLHRGLFVPVEVLKQLRSGRMSEA
jgi:hypothetical protein